MPEFQNKSSQRGLSLVEILVATSIFGLILALIPTAIKIFEATQTAINLKTTQSGQLMNLRGLMRNAFNYRSSMDPATGNLSPESSVIDEGSNSFSIRVRFKDNQAIVGKVVISNECVASPKNRARPEIETSFCQNQPTQCAVNQRMVVRVRFFENEKSSTVRNTIEIPPTGSRKSDDVSGAAICLVELSGTPPARIRTKVGFEKLAVNNQYVWTSEYIELWEDLAASGVEFLR